MISSAAPNPDDAERRQRRPDRVGARAFDGRRQAEPEPCRELAALYGPIGCLEQDEGDDGHQGERRYQHRRGGLDEPVVAEVEQQRGDERAMRAAQR